MDPNMMGMMGGFPQTGMMPYPGGGDDMYGAQPGMIGTPGMPQGEMYQQQ